MAEPIEAAESGLSLAGALRAAVLRRVVRAIDGVVSRAAGRPATLRLDAPLGGLVQGRILALDIELTEAEVGKLVVDHLLIRLTDLRLLPAFPARIHIPHIQLVATVTQRWVDRWLSSEPLPLHLRLGESGLATSWSLDSLGLGEIETELIVAGPRLRLRPLRAGLVEIPEVVRDFFSGSLPLPPLPRGARLAAIEHGAGELTTYLELPGFDEDLSLGLGRRLRRRLVAAVPETRREL